MILSTRIEFLAAADFLARGRGHFRCRCFEICTHWAAALDRAVEAGIMGSGYGR